MVRVSGGSGGLGGFSFIGIVQALLGIIYSLSFIGEAVGLSGQAAAIVGTTVVIVGAVLVITVVTTKMGSGRGKSGIMPSKRGKGGRFVSKINYDPDRRGEYEVSPGESSGTHEIPASTIDVAPAPLHPPVGLHVELPGLPDRFDVRAFWPRGQVFLEWDTPLFDPEKFELMGYEVIEMLYDGSSTVPVRGKVFEVSPDATQWNGDFKQEHRWSTGGDKDGFDVTPVFRDLHPDFPNRIVRVPDTVRPPPGL